MARQPAQGPPKEPSVSDNRVSPKPAPGGRTDRQPVDDPQKSSQQGAKQSDEAFVGAERMPDGRLKIQAIAWAPDPQERMAVIDNRILREGDSVGGYTIIAIAEDQILLSGEGRRWKIIFGRR
jgi:type II secretory pathway component PulC